MKTLLNPWFLLFCAVWLVIFTLTKFHIYLPNFIQFYVLDIIAVPVLANLGLWFWRFILQDNTRLLNFWQLIFIVLSVSIIFEVVMPTIKPNRYSADVFDVVSYVFGAMFFWWVMNKPSLKI